MESQPTPSELAHRALLLDIRERDIESQRRQNDAEIAESKAKLAEEMAQFKSKDAQYERTTSRNEIKRCTT